MRCGRPARRARPRVREGCPDPASRVDEVRELEKIRESYPAPTRNPRPRRAAADQERIPRAVPAIHGFGNPSILGGGPRTGPFPERAALLPGRPSPAQRARDMSFPPMASSLPRDHPGALEIRLERSPRPRSGAMQKHPLIRLLDRESVTHLVGRPSLHIPEPQDDSQVRWECVDDGLEPLPELFGQE